jgi:outer membrane protease
MIENSDKMIASGSCGANLEWFLTGEEDNYTLTVSGTGNMENYEWSDSAAPWRKYRSSIKTVKI